MLGEVTYDRMVEPVLVLRVREAMALVVGEEVLDRHTAISQGSNDVVGLRLDDAGVVRAWATKSGVRIFSTMVMGDRVAISSAWAGSSGLPT